jgi:hypothetical protein
MPMRTLAVWTRVMRRAKGQERDRFEGDGG